MAKRRRLSEPVGCRSRALAELYGRAALSAKKPGFPGPRQTSEVEQDGDEHTEQGAVDQGEDDVEHGFLSVEGMGGASHAPPRFASRLGGCLGRRLVLGELRAGGVGGLGRDDPGLPLDLGGAREVLAQVPAQDLRVHTDLLGEGLGRDGGRVGHGTPFVRLVGASGARRGVHVTYMTRSPVSILNS